ncbi:restriction endonuclease subunit S [Pseudomonas sp. H1_A03]
MSFRAYPEYKPSGFDWLPEVPAHWVDRKIARDIPFVVGWTPPSGKDEYYDGDLPWVTIADMTQMSVEDTKSKISHLAVQDKGAKVVPAGSMLFSFKLSVGKIAFLTIDSYTNEAIAGFLPCGPLDLEYWKYAAPEFIPRYGRENIYGATLLNQELISSVRFSAPARAEQTQIARFLDHETARIDALIEEQQRLIELLKEKRQAVISHAVTKGLDPTVPMKDSGVEWLGEVPAHWEVKQLKHVVDPNTSITYGIVQAGPEFEGGIPYIRTSDMSGEELPVSGYPLTSPDIDESYARSRVRPGDIVMSIRASVGKCLPVPDELKVANLTQGTAKISAGQDITRNFLLAFLNAGATQNYFDLMAKGATFKEITLDALRRTPVLLPPVNEQIYIDQLVAKHTGLLDEICKQAIQSVSLLKQRRSALISAAVTGKIDVRGWQPPASARTPELVEEAV